MDVGVELEGESDRHPSTRVIEKIMQGCKEPSSKESHGTSPPSGAIFSTLWPARALSCHVSQDYLRRNEKN